MRDEIAGLRSQIDALQRVVSESEIRRKLNNALGIIESTASRLIPYLDAEWPDAPIKLIIEEYDSEGHSRVPATIIFGKSEAALTGLHTTSP